MGIGKVNSVTAAALQKVNSLAKASINKINSAAASFAAVFTDDISFDFDGTNDRMTNSTNLNTEFIGGASTLGAGSISVWCKLDSMSANGFIFGLFAEEGSTNQVILLWNNAAARIRGNAKLAGTANTVDSGAGLENDDSYHHVAFTWEYGSKTSANNEAKIYIDGSNTATNAIGSSNWNDGTGPATIVFSANGVNGGTENNWNGHLNDIALFNDKLTAGEVTAIYNSGAPKDESSHSGLVAYYTMEGYSDGDTTLTDDSGNGHTLTIVNSTNIDSTDTP
jgi:hypothetical protein|tara:strand:- start:353 stop:1192 length:840 start_codon:yes stop_codon:yes gene_type:complete